MSSLVGTFENLLLAAILAKVARRLTEVMEYVSLARVVGAKTIVKYAGLVYST